MIHWKWRNEVDYSTITLDGNFITVAELKRRIIDDQGFEPPTDFDLSFRDASTDKGLH